MAEEATSFILEPSSRDASIIAETPDEKNATFKVPTMCVRPRPPLVDSITVTEQDRPREFTLSPPPHQTSESTNQTQTSQQIADGKPKRVNQAKPTDVPYKEPSWSGVPSADLSYSFEILKGGVIVGSYDIGMRSHVVCGRHVGCDLVMEHPSISRYHAILQYRQCDAPICSGDVKNVNKDERPDGFYVYDLGSTHGTFLNKNQLKPHRYYRLFVGHMLRFGGSSRTYLMQGPEYDTEEESNFTVTEMRRLTQLKYLQAAQQASKNKMEETVQQEQGIDWGMGEDAVEEDEGAEDEADHDEASGLGINPFSLHMATPNEDTYIDDPKKTLRSWFEREGFELEYEIEEKGQAHFLCRIRLPLDHSQTGEPVIIEASVKGKKKEAVAACALDACRTLDRHGVLRQSKQEARPRKKKRDWANDDYYDSDEDTFLDRTGTIEKKRKDRMRKAEDGSFLETGAGHSCKVETYESLLAKYAKVNEDLCQVKEALGQSNTVVAGDNKDTVDKDDDALDAYMRALDKGVPLIQDKTEKSRLKIKQQQLKQESDKLARLIKIARPTSLPSLVEPVIVAANRISSKVNATEMAKFQTGNLVTDEPKVDKDCLGTQESRLQIKEIPSKIMEPSKEQASRILKVDTEGAMSKPLNTESCNKLQENQSQLNSTNHGSSGTIIVAIEESKKKRHKAIRKSKEAKYDYDKLDPNYAMWIPPDDQSGDGRTCLNEKYGY